MDLKKLLAPKTVAIVGASEKEGFGGDTCRNALSYADMSKVYFINPKRDEVFGQKCWTSLESLPVSIDLVIICTPQKTVEGLLREAAAKGAGGAVVYASGYSEVGTDEGYAADASLKALCKELNIALMGPNCAGFMNYIDEISAFAFISEERDRKGSVGIVSQSGQLCLTLMDSPSTRFSYSISSGNCAVVSMEDYLMYLVEDDATKVIGLYMEGATQPKKFEEALKAAAIKRKPIVVLKTGSSEKGSLIAASHTGSLSGADRMYDVMFNKFGVIRVRDVQELLSTTGLFATLTELPKQSGFASINLSGGETAMCADVGEMENIDFPDFTSTTLAKLKELLPTYASPANPLDTTASISYDADVYANVVQTVIDDPNIGFIVLGYNLLLEIADPAIKYMTEGIEKVVKGGRTKPMAMLSFIENTRNAEYADRLTKAGVTILPPPIYGFSVLRHLKDFMNYNYKDHTLELAIPTTEMAEGRKTLSELDSMEVLREYNIPTLDARITTTVDDAVAFADSIGYPVVMKVASADIAHKSDMGGVLVNMKNASDVRTGFETINNNAKKNAPHAKLDGVLVQKMLAPGMEVIIGVNNDPQFGPAVLVGLGGIFVEIFKDTVMMPAPFDKKEALVMINSLKASPLFHGYRGNAELDVDALAQMVADVAKLAADKKDTLAELDINPVFVYEKGKGVCPADALIVLQDNLK